MIGEVIQHLFDTHGILGREHVLAEEAADVGIAGRVDVDRERRERLAGGAMERIVDDLVVRFGVQFGYDAGVLALCCLACRWRCRPPPPSLPSSAPRVLRRPFCTWRNCRPNPNRFSRAGNPPARFSRGLCPTTCQADRDSGQSHDRPKLRNVCDAFMRCLPEAAEE